MSKITKILFLFLVVLLSTSVVLTSCKKEEDIVVEKTPTEKLIGTWKISKNLLNNQEQELDDYDKNSRLIFLSSTTGKFTEYGQTIELFEWMLMNNNTKLRITTNEDGDVETYDFNIIKLTDTEFWFDVNEDGDVYEQQYIKE